MGEKTFAVCCGIAGGVIAEFFGGWSDSMTTLVILMAIDYITGLIVAGVFHKSKKSRTGKLESLTIHLWSRYHRFPRHVFGFCRLP